ncbi:Uridine_kinase domain-containing protein [Hexamita inflata]|uniref:uridine/cytidine kinase n=1 Tax=Hexamita inflata TaxID=28002 RepID=A0AA86UY82_9EUKA|nr:Uridine kinase domain-containing protein [Hexamita inflata]
MDTFQYVEQLKKNMENNRSKVAFIGVAGGSASGKTSITAIIKQYFSDTKSVSVVTIDDFYRDKSEELIARFNGRINWDDPYMIDDQQLLACLHSLAERKPYTMNKFDYKVSMHSSETITIVPADIIIVEGIFAFYWQHIRELQKLRIFVDCSGESRLMRRIIRDVKERGRTVESVIEQYARFVKPSFDKFIQPQIKQAHLVLPWENIDQNTNLAAVELLINYISVLASQSNSRPATPREYQ